MTPEQQLAEFDRNSNNIPVNNGSGYPGDNAHGAGNNSVPPTGDSYGQHPGYDGAADGGYVQGNNYNGVGKGGYAQDHGGAPTSGSFGTHGNSSEDDYYSCSFTNPGLHVLTHPTARHRHALMAVTRGDDATQWWVGDSGASVHATSKCNPHVQSANPCH